MFQRFKIGIRYFTGFDKIIISDGKSKIRENSLLFRWGLYFHAPFDLGIGEFSGAFIIAFRDPLIFVEFRLNLWRSALIFEFTIFFNYSALLSHSLRWGSRQFLFGSPPCWCVLTGFPYSCALRAPYILLVISSFSKFGLFISEYFCPQFVQSEIATMGFPLLSTRGHGIYSASPWTIGFLIFSTGYGIIILFICSYISNPSLSLFSVGVPDLNTFRLSTWQFRLNIYE